MPKVKDRSALAKSDLEKRYELALNGLEDETYDTLAKAAQAHDLRKSSLGHRRNGRHSQQVARPADLYSDDREGNCSLDIEARRPWNTTG